MCLLTYNSEYSVCFSSPYSGSHGSSCIQHLLEQVLVFSASSNPVMHLCQDLASSTQCKSSRSVGMKSRIPSPLAVAISQYCPSKKTFKASRPQSRPLQCSQQLPRSQFWYSPETINASLSVGFINYFSR